jgi:5-formyltetrahydrofolate cyclo-ligase
MTQVEAAAVLKRELRKRMRGVMRQISQDQIANESRVLTDKLKRAALYKRAENIALYASMGHEFDTRAIMQDAFDANKRVFIPRIVSKVSRAMAMLEVRSMAEFDEWIPNSWGIREPPLEAGRMDAPRDTALDLIIVPGVAFDMSGARCGYGMGFYDTFLSRYRGSRGTMPRLVAPVLRAQLVESVPMTDTDWRVDELILAD